MSDVQQQMIDKLWSFIIDKLDLVLDKGFKIVIVLVAMFIIIKLSNRAISKFVERQIKSNARFSLEPQKAKTLGAVFKSGIKYITYFIGITLILSGIFSGVSVAIAGAGGVALGFGAQNLLKDFINGIFILFEDQFGVGDYITINKYSGIVESIGIRTTAIRDFSGDLHLIPNGNIAEITNHSRGNIRFVIDVQIAYEENINTAINVIQKVCDDFNKDNQDITEKAKVFGVTELSEDGVNIRVMGKAKPLKQWGIEYELRKQIKLKLDEEKIEIPYRKMQIVNFEKGVEQNG